MIEHSFKNWTLSDHLVVHQIPLKEFRPWFAKNRPRLFPDTLDFNSQEILSELDKEKQKQLSERLSNVFTAALVLYHQNEIIGWSFGRQESFEKFYQVNSAILPEYRNRGLYKKLLKIMIEVVKSEGFQIIYSRHAATNSSVIVPKLKSGFVISALELSDTFGTLVHLTYFTDPTRKKVMEFRCGDLRPDEQLKSLLKL
ncbi:MAG: GNAT family N-acetyltransferase [Bdellovibrionaceae bacterium]|nr:GNAT family N-acetyltransferase [Pseudobdellovibrionaceae bacterium]